MTRPISASQLKSYDACPRKWAFRYLEGLESPSTPATEHGKFIHAQMEAWLKLGVLPTHPQALKLLGLFAGSTVAPTRNNAEAEQEFTLHIQGVAWRGFMDWRIVGGYNRGESVIVGDWKTTSDMKYALRPDRGVLVDNDGKVDVQSTLYAAKEYTGGAKDVVANWAYVTTKGTLSAKLVDIAFDRAHVEDVYGGMHARAQEIQRLVQIRPKTSDVPYRSGSCFAFHRPCEYTDRCIRPQGMFISAPLDLTQNEAAKMTDFISSMKSSYPNDEEAPPPPPADDEDAPPAPPEDDAPPPPPVDEDHEAELIVAEYLAGQGKPYLARSIGKPEAGFINAPEAEELPFAAATPEEARELYGAAPVKEPKAKKPKAPKKLTMKEKLAAEKAAAEAGGEDGVVLTYVNASPADALRPNDRHGLVESNPVAAQGEALKVALVDGYGAPLERVSPDVLDEPFVPDFARPSEAAFEAEGQVYASKSAMEREMFQDELRQIIREELRAYFSR